MFIPSGKVCPWLCGPLFGPLAIRLPVYLTPYLPPGNFDPLFAPLATLPVNISADKENLFACLAETNQ